MDDDVAGVDQHPVRAVGAFDADALDAGGVQFHFEMGGHGDDLAVGEAGGDDHPVGEGGAAGEVEGGDRLGLVVLEAGDDHRLQPVERLGVALHVALRRAARTGDGGFLARGARRFGGFGEAHGRFGDSPLGRGFGGSRFGRRRGGLAGDRRSPDVLCLRSSVADDGSSRPPRKTHAGGLDPATVGAAAARRRADASRCAA